MIVQFPQKVNKKKYTLPYNEAAAPGIDGGVQVILDVIAEAIKKQQQEAYVDWVIREHIDPLNYDAKIEAMRQYLNKFAPTLPAGTKMKKAIELAATHEEILKFHTKYLSSLPIISRY